MTGVELFLGAFIVASQNWGFSDGVGVEAELKSKYIDVDLSVTNEVKYGNENGYTYSGGITLSHQIVQSNERFRALLGYIYSGYRATNWSKAGFTPTVGLRYEGRRTQIEANYIFENEWSDAVTTLGIRTQVTGTRRFFLTLQGGVSDGRFFQSIGGAVLF